MSKEDNYSGAECAKTGTENAYNWFRCEPMTLCQLFLQSESTYSAVSLLGESGICQFRDLNPNINAFQRKFVNEHRRCVEMERKIGFFEKEIERDNIPILSCNNEPPAPSIKEITKLESQLEKLENDLVVANKNRVMLKRKLLELTELRHILKQADQFFEEAQGPETNKTSKAMRRMSVVDAQLMRRFSTQISNSDINIPLDPVVDMFTMTGTLLASRFISFERMVWRICRGNILLKRMDIDENLEDPETGELQNKCLFILVVQGEKLRTNCQKICDGYHTTLHNCPDRTEERKKMHAGVVQQIEEMMIVIKQGDEHRSRILVAAAKNLRQWKISLAKMRSIYEIMNCFSFDITAKCLIAECWIPSRKVNTARAALQEGQRLSNSTVPSVLTIMATKETPPSYNVTNKFTAGFQSIIDSYGVSQYGEVNPAPFAIISFPFIFAVMFGDTGHGIIMALFALWMVIRERSLAKMDGEIFTMFFMGRYIILLMGIFSIYTGLIYNDIFSKSMNIFGSEYLAPNFTDTCVENGTKFACFKNTTNTLDPQNDTVEEYTYYFGLDPIWQVSTNKVLFLNAYKMKMSVIVGVLQMFFGVMLSIFNHIHFSKWVNIFTEFIPQVIFLLSIFGYMNFMIIFKWLSYSSANSFCAPSILITFINMFMFKQPLDGDPCYLKDPMYDNQFMIQAVLIVVAVACIPWMLIPKPFILRAQNQKKLQKQDHELIELQNRQLSMNGAHKLTPSTSSDSSSHIDINDDFGTDPNAPKEEKFEFGDVFINQSIHTIEYCLGSVSHTASYLRLWALSLAHAQLSEVLWNMVMANGFMEFHTGPPSVWNIVSAVVMFVVFAVWAVLTVAVLILMEGLSAFLHALRLHWVEFMSKFYSGSGYAFIPFSFSLIISEL